MMDRCAMITEGDESPPFKFSSESARSAGRGEDAARDTKSKNVNVNVNTRTSKITSTTSELRHQKRRQSKQIEPKSSQLQETPRTTRTSRSSRARPDGCGGGGGGGRARIRLNRELVTRLGAVVARMATPTSPTASSQAELHRSPDESSLSSSAASIAGPFNGQSMEKMVQNDDQGGREGEGEDEEAPPRASEGTCTSTAGDAGQDTQIAQMLNDTDQLCSNGDANEQLQLDDLRRRGEQRNQRQQMGLAWRRPKWEDCSSSNLTITPTTIYTNHHRKNIKTNSINDFDELALMAAENISSSSSSRAAAASAPSLPHLTSFNGKMKSKTLPVSNKSTSNIISQNENYSNYLLESRESNTINFKFNDDHRSSESAIKQRDGVAIRGAGDCFLQVSSADFESCELITVRKLQQEDSNRDQIQSEQIEAKNGTRGAFSGRFARSLDKCDSFIQTTNKNELIAPLDQQQIGLKINRKGERKRKKKAKVKHRYVALLSAGGDAVNCYTKTARNCRLLCSISTVLAVIFLLFSSSNPRMSLVASGLSLNQQQQQQQEQPMERENSDFNAAILATMGNQNNQLNRSSQQQQQQQQQSPFKQNANQNNNQNNQLELLMAKFDENNNSNNNESQSAANGTSSSTSNGNNYFESDLLESLLTVGRIFIMGAIIIGDICGNSLVILSVCRHSKLRVTTNWFVVSLACADILVALFAMTFNASVIISGKWLFKPWVCDFWNSCDVLASTASILHLCCISIDRYIAITRPLDYPMKITTKRVMYALCVVWLSSALLSYLPIFTGIYTTNEHLDWLKKNPDKCDFVVNQHYAIVSSSISFWIPCCIMVFTYYRIYMEASRQEKLIHQAQSIMPAPMPNHHHGHAHHGHHGHHNQQQQHLGSGASKHSAGSSGGGGDSLPARQRRSKSMALGSQNCPAEKGGQSQNARIKQFAVAQQLQQFETSTSGNQQANEPAKLATTQLTASPPDDPNAEKEPLQRAGGGETATSGDETAPLGGGGGGGMVMMTMPSSTSGDNNNNNNSTTTTTSIKNNNATFNLKNNTNHKNSKHFNNKDSFNLKTGNHHSKKFHQAEHEQDEELDDFDPRDPNSGQSTPTKRSISKMKREHKAAKTLGIIMGVFILCWLPFFSWYTPMHICGHACDGIVPSQVVTILFWIGYFNSTLNPIIYAYFNSEFRDAFKKTLQWIFCCCQDLKCLRVNRGNDNQHYNCTYRSTQEIVLVSNG